ncbi:MAG: DUF3611 family protein [Pleurocapsa sp.]
MNKDSGITPFASKSPKSAVSYTVRRISLAFKWAGLIGFWTQLVLGVISTVMLLLAITNRTERNSAGTGFSIFCAACGLICLIVAIYFSYRYSKMARSFENTNAVRPKRVETIKLIKISVVVSLVGMFLTIIGAEAIAGIVLSKILAFDPAKIFNNQTSSEFVNSLDLFIVQANTNIIAAHFAGLVSSLWLLNRITK